MSELYRYIRSVETSVTNNECACCYLSLFTMAMENVFFIKYVSIRDTGQSTESVINIYGPQTRTIE